MKADLAIIFVILIIPGLSQPVLAAAGFELRPSKVELTLFPGEQARRELLITNQTALTVQVGVSVEDFVAGQDPSEPIRLLEAETNPYSLRPFLTPLSRSLTLTPGESVSVPVLISLPAVASPGGLYGAVILSFDPVGSPIGSPTSARSRLGALFFVRVAGEVKEEGKLVGFGQLSRRAFHLDYANTGNVYLNPYGQLTIINRLTGQIISKLIDPWFVLPGSVRLREINLDQDLSLGWYQVKLALNRGYGNIIDRQEINLLIWSWSVLAIILISIVILIILIKKFL